MSTHRAFIPVAMIAVLACSCGGVAEGTPAPAQQSADGGPDAPSCKPSTCASLGVECGNTPDGCGAVVGCGSCAAPKVCGGAGPNRCGDAPCAPRSCADQGANCGNVSDQCSDSLDCGVCVAPQTCGGAGTTHQCGCTPTSCAAVGAACGTLADGCGASIDCGGCTLPDVCGGAGTPNQCGTPCDLIAKHAKWLVCKETATHCSGLYQDGAGCAAYCAAAGMVCKSRWGAHDPCQKETDYSIPCDEKNDHASDWCECGY